MTSNSDQALAEVVERLTQTIKGLAEGKTSRIWPKQTAADLTALLAAYQSAEQIVSNSFATLNLIYERAESAERERDELRAKVSAIGRYASGSGDGSRTFASCIALLNLIDDLCREQLNKDQGE